MEYRAWLANGGDGSFETWSASGKPKDVLADGSIGSVAPEEFDSESDNNNEEGTNDFNWKGEKVETYEGHEWSPLDPKMSEPPIVNPGSFTDAQRKAFLKGKSGGTKIAPHHRHQLPTETHGGVIDELRGPGHPDADNHTALVDGLNRHPGESYFNKSEGGKAQRAREIRDHFRAKGERLIPHPTNPGEWLIPASQSIDNQTIGTS